MPSTHGDPHKSVVQAEETPPEESAAADSGGLLSLLRSKLQASEGESPAAYHRRQQIWMLALVFSLSAAVALGAWGLFSVFGLMSGHFGSEGEEMPAVVQEAVEPSGPAELEKAKREAQQALAEAERQRQLNVARMQADRYQWEAWQQTVRETEENKRRLAEKQRIADEKAAEDARLARIEEQKRLEEERRIIAAKAPEARAAARTKKRMKTFE